MRYLRPRTVRLQVERDPSTNMTTVFALDDAEQSLLRTAPASWERYRWHLENNFGVDPGVLRDADIKLTVKPFKASLGAIETTDVNLEQCGFESVQKSLQDRR